MCHWLCKGRRFFVVFCNGQRVKGLYSERSCVSPSQLIAELVDQHGHKLPMGGQEDKRSAYEKSNSFRDT